MTHHVRHLTLGNLCTAPEFCDLPTHTPRHAFPIQAVTTPFAQPVGRHRANVPVDSPPALKVRVR